MSTSAERDETVAVIGAGPYGLSVAAHLRALGVRIHVFGEPLEYWRKHMPEGMQLKSSWRASSIASPDDRLSLLNHQRKHGTALRRPIPIADFIEYGQWYQRTAVPDIDQRRVARVDRAPKGFSLSLSDGDQLAAARVVLATGLHEFPYRPAPFDRLPRGLVSHTSDRLRLDQFAGARLCVIGAGQSAIESAVLADEAGAQVNVVVRERGVHWLTRKAALEGGLGRKLYASSDVGPAGLSWVVAFPDLMRRLPSAARRRMIRRCLRPAATGWLAPRAQGLTFTCRRRVVSANASMSGGAQLTLDGGSAVQAAHVLLGTGFRPEVAAVSILAPELRAAIRQRDGHPVLGEGFETSVPGLYTVGALAADSFGPLMRFVCGTWYAAPALARHVARRVSAGPRSTRPSPSTRSPMDVSQPPG